ncbi:MAG: PEP-CTERM sorting domain-containing protein [Myxococcota bacterium]
MIRTAAADLLPIPAALVLCAFVLASSQSLAQVGYYELRLGDESIVLDDVSGDGRVVAGTGDDFGFRWTIEDGFTPIPRRIVDGTAVRGTPRSLSSDGNAFFGNSFTVENFLEPTVWNADGTITSVYSSLRPGVEDTDSEGISGDGSVSVGWSYAPDFGTEGFLYDDTNGLRYLADLTGDERSTKLNAVSADGRKAVGWIIQPENPRTTEILIYDADREAGNGIQVLGDLAGGAIRAEALSISADGSTVVGYGLPEGNNFEAFVHTDAEGLFSIGTLGPDYDADRSKAFDVSGDGSKVVGESSDYAFIWDRANGMVELGLYFELMGLDLNGTTPLSASAISDDGRTIIGYGIDSNGEFVSWVAVIPEPSTALLLAFGLLGLSLSRP